MEEIRLIAITGGIGTGKSSVSRFWAKYEKLPLINIDQLCRELLEVGMPGWAALQENFGDVFFRSDDQLDRPALRAAIFADDALRIDVNRLIHPLALDLFQKRAAEMKQPVLVDVPLLFEAGWEGRFHHIVVVYADQPTCCSRISVRDKIATSEAAKAIVAQMNTWNKALLADHVIDNRYDWFRTSLQVIHLARFLRTEFS